MGDVFSAGAAALKQRRQQRELSERATRWKQLESESLSLFNSVVDAQPPTAALEQCTTHRQQYITEMVPEQLLLCVLSGHVEGMKRALHLFEQAMDFYKKALLLRQEVQIANLNTYAQPDQRSVDTERRLNVQARMDRVTNAAGMVAMRAHRDVGMLLASFPQEARTRYPQLCGSLGAIPYPMMNDERFELRDTAADDTPRFGCDVRDNLEVISQCVTITFPHLSTLEAVCTAVSATIDQWGQKISDWDAKNASERRNMFASARASTLDRRPVSVDVLDNRG